MKQEDLASQVERGEIDTVIVAFTDMQGRLMGKRVDAEYFVESSSQDASTEGCNYLLTVDVDMATLTCTPTSALCAVSHGSKRLLSPFAT